MKNEYNLTQIRFCVDQNINKTFSDISTESFDQQKKLKTNLNITEIKIYQEN